MEDFEGTDMSEELAEFFSNKMSEAEEAGDTEDEGNEALESSEQDDDGEVDDQTTEDDGDSSDEEDEAQAPPTDTVSKMALKLRDRERQLTEMRASHRALEQEVKRLSDTKRQEEQEPADVIEHFRHVMARRMRLTPDDPAVSEALWDVVTDITIDKLGSAADEVPDLKARREARQRQQSENEKYRELKERLDRSERAELEAKRQAQEQSALNGIGQFLVGNKEQFPFLMEQDDVDPVRAVWDLFLEGVQTGQIPQQLTEDQAAEVLSTIAGNMDGHYRRLAEKLANRLGNSATKKSEQGKAKKQTPQKRTGTASGTGGGGRGAPPPTVREDSDEEDFDSFMRRRVRQDQTVRRKTR